MDFRQGPVEGVAMKSAFWSGKTVLVTGHTGFKGGWLSLWLQRLGAEVVGYALPPGTEPSLFEKADVARNMTSLFGDIRDLPQLQTVLERHRPQVVFHLAAQALVRQSYDAPVDTYASNVMGTVNLLESVRHTPSVRVCQVITSDKCYENREWDYPYREVDRLGGRDPYSSSKACAELVAAAYRDSFFAGAGAPSLATVRAGNVIGGGDWSQDRLIPDCIRALARNEPVIARNPAAVRPWQHVLEPLSGYLWLAARQWQEPGRFAGAWNFGPAANDAIPVGALLDQVVAAWGGGSWRPLADSAGEPHEAGLLKLDISKAAARLGWRPTYTVAQAVEQTVAWYRQARQSSVDDIRAVCHRQIDDYVAAAQRWGAPWAQP